MIKEYVFTEVISGFNEDIVAENKPGALLYAKNADLESQPGSLRKRKGFEILGEQVSYNKPILGMYNFIKDDGTHTPVAVVNLSSSVAAKQLWLSPEISGLLLLTEEEDYLITEDGDNLIT